MVQILQGIPGGTGFVGHPYGHNQGGMVQNPNPGINQPRPPGHMIHPGGVGQSEWLLK